MSDAVAPPSGDGMENNIRAAYDCLPEITKRRKTSRTVRSLALITYVLIVVLGIWSAIATVEKNVVDGAPELAQNLQQNMMSMVPTLEKQAQDKAGALIPKMQAELARAQKSAQKTLANELTGPNGAAATMQASISRDLDAMINRRFDSVREGYRTRLEAAFPEALSCNKETDSEKACAAKKEKSDLLLNLTVESQQKWAQKELTSTYAGHLHEFEQIAQTMSGFTANKNGAKKPSSDTPEDMLMLWLEFASEAMAGSNDLFEAPKAKK